MSDTYYGNWLCLIALIILIYAIYHDSNKSTANAVNNVTVVETKKIKTDAPSTSSTDHTKDDININTVNTTIKPINTVPTATKKLAVLYSERDYEGIEKTVLLREKIKLVEFDPCRHKPLWIYKSLKINEDESDKISIKLFSRVINNMGIFSDNVLEISDSRDIYNIRDLESYLSETNIEIPEGVNTQVVIFLTINPKVRTD